MRGFGPIVGYGQIGCSLRPAGFAVRPPGGLVVLDMGGTVRGLTSRLVASVGAIVIAAAAVVVLVVPGSSPDPPAAPKLSVAADPPAGHDLSDPVVAAAVVGELWATRQEWAGPDWDSIAAIHPYQGGVLVLVWGPTDPDRIRISNLPIGLRESVRVDNGGVWPPPCDHAQPDEICVEEPVGAVRPG